MTGCLTAKCEIDRLLMVLLYFDDRKCFLSKLSTRGLVSSGANEGNYHISRRRSIVDATALLLGGGETIRRTFPRRIRQTTIEKYRKKIEERGSLNTFEWHVVCSPNIFIGERIKKTKREKENESNPRQNSSTKPTTSAQQLLLFRRNFMGKQGAPSRKAAAIFIRFLFFFIYSTLY